MKFSCEVIEEIGELRNVFQSNQTLEYIIYKVWASNIYVDNYFWQHLEFGNRTLAKLLAHHDNNTFFSYLYIETSKVEENADQLSLNANV